MMLYWYHGFGNIYSKSTVLRVNFLLTAAVRGKPKANKILARDYYHVDPN